MNHIFFVSVYSENFTKTRGVDPGGLGVPENMKEGSEYVLTP